MPRGLAAVQSADVTFFGHPGDQVRPSGGSRGDHEERRPRPELSEQVEQAGGPDRVRPVVEGQRNHPRCLPGPAPGNPKPRGIQVGILVFASGPRVGKSRTRETEMETAWPTT